MRISRQKATGKKSTHDQHRAGKVIGRKSANAKKPNVKMTCKKFGPIMPVWGARKGQIMQIKSWRMWIEFQDGAWHAETSKSLNEHQKAILKSKIENGSEVWPWPNGNSPTDTVKRQTLKQKKMKEYVDGNKVWTHIPQNVINDDDESHDLPNQQDSLFAITDENGMPVSSTDSSDTDESTDINDEDESEEEDEYS
jgi:hypothetical protein